MGENERRGQQPENGLLPNGLLLDDAASVIQPLDPDRWSIAEQRTAELIMFIKPNKPSEELRTAVASYVRRLIMNCFPCQVFTFGSVPLKTYLPDGDIDLTTFSNNEMKETWALQVRDTLENEERNENAEFRVKEVQYIQAEVKIIKCLVENIVVDISFNQLGGLCTLCFLEEVDNLISQDHLFKRSIILIKAWCYYESRVLGAHHGLISTYALETLVLYIFHVFNNSFTGPLEVLYRFLEFFSKFDWDNFCISLWGPVPISSLPDVAAEPPRKDGGELLLSKLFLEACSAVYAVFPSGQENQNQSQSFVSKYFNVIDPLRVNNNLGRSVSKGNFFRIRSAFAFGAKRLGRLLDCPKEDIYSEVSQFFMNTWDRHGNCQRPDAPRTGLLLSRLQKLGQLNGYEMAGYASGARFSNQQNSDFVMDQRNSAETIDSKAEEAVEKATKKTKDYSNFDMGRYLFVRTRSSPELTDGCQDFSSQSRRARAFDSKKHQPGSVRSSSSQKRSPENEIVSNHSSRSSTEDRTSSRQECLPQCFDATFEASCAPSGADGEEIFPSLRTHEMIQDEQDMVNMMAASTSVGFCSQFNAPMNLPFSFSPILASMGCNQRNMGVGVLPPNMNIPMIDPWGTNPQFSQGLVSPQLAPYFSGLELASNPDDSGPVDGDHIDWHDRSTHSPLVSFPNSKTLQRTYVDEDAYPPRDERSNMSLESSRSNGRIPPDPSSDGTSSKASRMPREKKGKRSSVQEKSKGLSEGNASSASESVIPLAPMILGHGSHSRTSDNVPLTFYPTGPPVPFVTMLPLYNFGNEPGSGDAPASPYGSEGAQSMMAADGSDGADLRTDILNSDFASHWQNLQYGRLCQSSRHPSPAMYQSPVYLQGRYPLEAPGRPNMNVFSQIMTYGNHFFPFAPLQSLSNIHKNHLDDLPRYRAGTGTYLPSPGPGPGPGPSPKASHRHGNSQGHNRKGSYYERNEQTSEREGKGRASSRGNNRSQTSSRHGRNGAELAPPMVMYYPSADHLELGSFGYVPFHKNVADDHPPP